MLPIDKHVKIRKLTQKSPFKLDLKGLFILLCFCQASRIFELRNRNEFDIKN